MPAKRRPAPRRRSPCRSTRRARSCSTRSPTSSSTRKASWTAICTPATRIPTWWRWSRSWRRSTAPRQSLLFSSGMAAISTALLTLLKAGDEIVCASAIYGGTFHIIEDLLPRLGITRRFVSLEELATPAEVIGPKTKIVWFESPINPTLRCVDVRGVAAACRKAGVLSAIDNTFASPINQPVLSMGDRPVDAKLHQIPERPQRRHRRRVVGIARRCWRRWRRCGGCSAASWIRCRPIALGRGMKTMPLRVAQHNANALAVAHVPRGASADRARLLPGARLASRSRNRQRADDRLRRRGHHRRQRRQGRARSAPSIA